MKRKRATDRQPAEDRSARPFAFQSGLPDITSGALKENMSVPEDFSAWAASKGAVLTGVEPRVLPGRGIGIVSTREIQPGEVLLRVPLSSFLTKRDIPHDVVKQAPGASVQGLLALHLALEASRQEPSTTPWRAVFPTLTDLSSMPILWDAALHSSLPAPARELLSKQISKFDSDWTSVSHLGLSRAEYTHSWLLVNTRSFYHSPSRLTPASDKLALIPIADLLNHASSGCPASFTPRGISITADKHYPPGSEIYTTYGRHGNDFLLTEYGFLLNDNEWDEVSLDDLLLPRLSAAQKAELQDAGFLGKWMLDRRTPGCFRTQVALRVLRGANTRAFLNGVEKEGVQGEVDVYLYEVLGEFLEDIERRVGAVEGMGLGGEVLAKRWRQIGELVAETRQLIQQ